MKKFIPAGIAAIGMVGFLGIGASAASAAPAVIPGPVQVAVCASLNASILTNLTPTANATAAENAAAAALTAANATIGTALTAYGTTVTTFIVDTDAHSPNVNVDAVAFQNAANSFVTALTTWSGARAAEATTSAALATITLQNTVLSSLKGSLGC